MLLISLLLLLNFQGTTTQDFIEDYEDVFNSTETFLNSTVASCEDTTFGCCKDGLRPAHGDGLLGCCAFTEFGCCDDDLTPAQGPYGEGCTKCEDSTFGCCPDGITSAGGQDLLGCGCRHSTFGCCPDGVTAASGPELEGCECSTRTHGCCPDGKMAAQGLLFEGCTACNSEEGCCEDGITSKTNSCDGCETSAFGCCLDGETPAIGPEFEGCPNPGIPGQMCHQPNKPGPCTNYEVKWFYDSKYGGCNRFWYGGCDPGANHFDDEESCRAVCVNPKGSRACFLKQNSGSCDANYQEWYYDYQTSSCLQFRYSGCLGNDNRFLEKQDCEDACFIAHNTFK